MMDEISEDQTNETPGEQTNDFGSDETAEEQIDETAEEQIDDIPGDQADEIPGEPTSAAPKRQAPDRRTGSTVRFIGGEETTVAQIISGTVEVKCAFCRGTGRDPWRRGDACRACRGNGYKKLRYPTAPCVLCRGTGKHPGFRLACSTCRGVGTVHIPADAVPCRYCGGTGRAEGPRRGIELSLAHGALYCTHCRGKGVVSAKRGRV